MRAFLVGMAVALCGLGHRYDSPLFPRRGPGRPAWWVADRGGDLLWELDADLLPRRKLPARAPVALAAVPGGVWVVEALQRDPLGAHQLRLVEGGGAGEHVLALPTFQALASTAVGPIVLTRSGELMSASGGQLRLLARMEGARWLLGAGHEIWVAGWGCQVSCLSARDGQVLAQYDLPGMVRGLSEAADGLPWALCAGRALLRVDLSEQPGIAPDIKAPLIAAGWILDQASARLQPIGRTRSTCLAGRLAGLESACALPGGGVLVVTAGSLHLLDPGGQRQLAQGGFGYAVSAVPVAGSGRL